MLPSTMYRCTRRSIKNSTYMMQASRVGHLPSILTRRRNADLLSANQTPSAAFKHCMSKPSARRDNLKSPGKNAMNPRPYSSNASITHDVTSEISKATPRSMTGSCLSPTSQPRLGYLCRGCAHIHIHIVQMTFQPER